MLKYIAELVIAILLLWIIGIGLIFYEVIFEVSYERAAVNLFLATGAVFLARKIVKAVRTAIIKTKEKLQD